MLDRESKNEVYDALEGVQMKFDEISPPGIWSTVSHLWFFLLSRTIVVVCIERSYVWYVWFGCLDRRDIAFEVDSFVLDCQHDVFEVQDVRGTGYGVRGGTQHPGQRLLPVNAQQQQITTSIDAG